MPGKALVLLTIASASALAAPFQFEAGDRVAMVGNTVIERAQEFGHLETLLAIAAGEGVDGVTFRNLGWSGDSVFGDARSYFGKPEEGRQRLAKVIGELQPTVLVACYGTGAAMSEDRGWTIDPAAEAKSRAGKEESLQLFVEQYGKLLDRMEMAAGGKIRETILVAPPPLENLGAPWPDQSARNRRLAEYREAIRDLAKERGARFVDLFAAMGGDEAEAGKVTESPLTDNGVHYGISGYEVIAAELVKGLGLKLPEGLSANDPAVVAMRSGVVKKNRLFFHRWRPVNETYLFLFRKHEQGQNAKEIPQFDPLIEEEERRIAGLRKKVFESVKKEK